MDGAVDMDETMVDCSAPDDNDMARCMDGAEDMAGTMVDCADGPGPGPGLGQSQGVVRLDN